MTTDEENIMKHGLSYAFGFLIAALLTLGTGPALADAVGP
jgi:hypothetical protein